MLFVGLAAALVAASSAWAAPDSVSSKQAEAQRCDVPDPGARRKPRARCRRVQPRERQARRDRERPAYEQGRAQAREGEPQARAEAAQRPPRRDVHVRKPGHGARGAARRDVDGRPALAARHDEPRFEPERRSAQAGQGLPRQGQGGARAAPDGARPAGQARRRALGGEGLDPGAARLAAAAPVLDQEPDHAAAGGGAGAAGTARGAGPHPAGIDRRDGAERERRGDHVAAARTRVRAASVEVRRRRRDRDAVPRDAVRLRRSESRAGSTAPAS